MGTISVFAVGWTISAFIGAVVYLWDVREAIYDGRYLDLPLPGFVQRRYIKSRRIIADNNLIGSLLIAIGEVFFLIVGITALLVPNQPSSTLTVRGIILLSGFVGGQACISLRGVIKIALRRQLRRIRNEESARRVVHRQTENDQ